MARTVQDARAPSYIDRIQLKAPAGLCLADCLEKQGIARIPAWKIGTEK